MKSVAKAFNVELLTLTGSQRGRREDNVPQCTALGGDVSRAGVVCTDIATDCRSIGVETDGKYSQYDCQAQD